jgi:hypothetical protein
MPTRALVFAVSVVIALLGAPLLSTTDVSAKRDRLRPTHCTVEPRTLADDSAQPAATPLPPEIAGVEADAFVDSPDDLPEGEPASDETVAEITVFLQELAGCLNTVDGLRVAGLMSDDAVASIGGEALRATVLGPVSDENDNATIEVAWVRLGDVVKMQDGRAASMVKFGVDYEGRTTGLPTTFVLIFEHVDGRWLLDGQINIDSEAYATISPGTAATPAATDDEALLDRARNGFTEVDSAIYAEPTMVGARFSLEAMLMVDSDVYPADVGCEIFFFERGEVSATVSAYCRAGASLTGRAARLTVTAYGPDRGVSGPAYYCEDIAPLAEHVIFSCTVELPPDAR